MVPQLAEGANWKVLIVNGAEAASPEIRAAVESSGREFVSSIVTLDEIIARGTARERLLARTVTGLAALALVLAAIGLYGLITFEARRRRKEMAIRFALGAPRAHVVAAQLWRTAIATIIGTIAGIGLAIVEAPLLSAHLFNVAPYDIASFVAGPGSLVLVAVAASIPAIVGILAQQTRLLLKAELQ